MLFGTITLWVTLIGTICALGFYLIANMRRIHDSDGGARWVKAGRIAFFAAVLGVFASAATLGTLLVTHQFDVQYVYEHSARAMAPLYWFPAFWSGQEGSFLLWSFWISLLGIILALTSGASERRVMPVYAATLLFLAIMLVVRSPFVPLDTQGQPVPTEGLGINPNLENYWMVIHPPTMFLGFASLSVLFAYALSALFWSDWDSWLRRALPWGLFGFAVLGLAMMMGGRWAYEMLGWGGFWGWDPVEVGPFIPWLGLVAFLHAAQIQTVRGGFNKPTLFAALIPFVTALYESFLTRTGVLDAFSVHSFSTLGGVGNALLLYALLTALVVSVGVWLWRLRRIPKNESTTESPVSREFGYTMALAILTICSLIALVGLSSPLLTGLGVKLGWTQHVASVKEDFYNRAMFPIGVLLAIGMGLTPLLAWRGMGTANIKWLNAFYALSVLSAFGFVFAAHHYGTLLTGRTLVPQLILFTASVFALLVNGTLFVRRLQKSSPSEEENKEQRTRRAWSVGGLLSHLGAAVLLIGIVCLVTFQQKDPTVVLAQGSANHNVLGGRYTITYLGQTSDYKTDKNNQLKFSVLSNDGRENFMAYMPFALRPIEGGEAKIIGHPAIAAHAGGDLYLALKDGPDQFYPNGLFQMGGEHSQMPAIKLGAAQKLGDYTLQLVRFERDPHAAAMAMANQMPDVFPVWAVMRVTYKGQSVLVRPENITRLADREMPESPEIKLPGGWLLAFTGMNAGSADASNPNAGAMSEAGKFTIRPPGPIVEAFQIEVTTRPMINLVWLGTFLIFAGGLVGMRRRILENRRVPIPDLPMPEPMGRKSANRRTAKSRAPQAKPAPSLAAAQKMHKG